MRLHLLVLLISILCVTTARAEFNDIVTGARPAGMGNAFVALSDDINALYWNPAALTLQKHMEVGFMHANELTPTGGPAIGTDFAGWSSGHGPYGAFGAAFLRQGLSDILQERTLSLSYGYALSPFTRVGANMKSMAVIVHPQGHFFPDPALNDDSTQALDLSFLHIITPDFRIGGLARNLLGRLGHVDRQDIHKSYRLGAAYKVRTEFIDEDYLWLTVDVFSKEDINDQAGLTIKNAVGAEYQITPWIAVRGGINNGRFTGGAGLSALGLHIDYSIAQAEEGIGTSQRVSLTYKFGGEIHTDRHEVTVRHHAAPKATPRLEKPPKSKPRRTPEGD